MLPLPAATDGKPLPDVELVALVLSGDTAAFGLLMRRYNRVLYRTARSIIKDDAEAEDVLQDAYMQAFRSLNKFRGEARLSTWLTRIVVNEAVARLRKAIRRAEVICLDGDIDQERPVDDAPHRSASDALPEEAAMRAQTRHLLEKKIDELPEVFRTVFVLRALEEMTVEEVGIVLGIPEATVRTRYFRGRSMLREALSRELDYALDEAFSFDGERCDRIVAGVMERLRAKGENDC